MLTLDGFLVLEIKDFYIQKKKKKDDVATLQAYYSTRKKIIYSTRKYTNFLCFLI